MKKTTIVLMFLFLVMSVVPVLAQDIDLTELSFAELSALKETVDAEFYSREEAEAPKGTLVPEGIYTVGKEIPEGSYITYPYYSSVVTEIYLYKNEANYEEREGETYMVSYKPREFGRILYLEEGNVVWVYRAPAIMSKVEGLVF